MADLFISWEEYHKKTEQLAVKVYDDKWDFNQVVCIAKGGMRVGDIFARLFNVPLAILSVESYKGDGFKKQRGAITFSRDLAQQGIDLITWGLDDTRESDLAKRLHCLFDIGVATVITDFPEKLASYALNNL